MQKIFLTLILLLFFTACSNEEKEMKDFNSTTEASLTQGESYNFDLNLNDNTSLFIQVKEGKIKFDTQNKATFFIFFTTWCKPCIAQVPHLNKLREKYQDQLQIVGILLEDKNPEDLAVFSAQNHLNYKIASGEGNYLFAKALGGISGIPTIFLFAKNGELFKHYLGVVPVEMLEIDILEAI
ncbi:TlpA family protein disulfide reductase [Campylobacter vulpis]|uniref:TlpA family protein disulfide reductase n=1 Tax=Campylobacter vulpis TaxID=1655500 RepID=UPI001BD088BD|nr:TlpA disulfide reductase family protein [Campylobacter vulpis]MBS4407695.1 TlpA family protein disulfide reductase [Campylobacter vulpis]